MPSIADQLAADIQAAVAQAFSQGLIEGTAPDSISLERPKIAIMVITRLR